MIQIAVTEIVVGDICQVKYGEYILFVFHFLFRSPESAVRK